MNYIDFDIVNKNIQNNPEYKNFIAQATLEVDDYFTNFSDSVERTSRWAHHYFCEDDGARLIYNDKTPESHICSSCGKEFSNDLFNGCWTTMYRNQGVTNAWKSALLYKVTKDEKYLNNLLGYADFYNDNYLDFKIHNKEGIEFDSLDDALWGCSRIMPQSLNEAIFITRLINALELVKDDLPNGYVDKLSKGIFAHSFTMFKPQVDRIHNIPTWLNSSIVTMGNFLQNKEMLEFAYPGDNGVLDQLTKGVTTDSFWYEGSIHYNFFLLEGVVNAMLFSEIYGYDFSGAKAVVEKMLIAAYDYAFDTHLLPNPNDGWPDVNLKTYSYVYSIAAKVFGQDSKVGKILGSILNMKGERGIVPLSKPYYFNNDISLEELLFVPELRATNNEIIKTESINFESSFCGLIKAYDSNIFLKYGHNGKSHAHPDKMNIEVILKGAVLSRELSNSGYGSPLCNEWHRVSTSHNTVVVNGEKHTGFGGGKTLEHSTSRFKAITEEVYEGVNFIREVELIEDGFNDNFKVELPEVSTCDYFFHIEGKLLSKLDYGTGSIGYTTNGYQHLKDLKEVTSNSEELTIKWNVEGQEFSSIYNLKDSQLFICQSPDNSKLGFRNTIIIRQKTDKAEFTAKWRS